MVAPNDDPGGTPKKKHFPQTRRQAEARDQGHVDRTFVQIFPEVRRAVEKRQFETRSACEELRRHAFDHLGKHRAAGSDHDPALHRLGHEDARCGEAVERLDVAPYGLFEPHRRLGGR